LWSQVPSGQALFSRDANTAISLRTMSISNPFT
jgi:hypothetical protein